MKWWPSPFQHYSRKPSQFDIPELANVYKKAKNICDHGVGFAVIDKLPLDDFAIEQMVDVYWTLGQYMGQNVAQKWDGTMVYDVTDTGKKFGYGVRGSATSVELVFHTQITLLESRSQIMLDYSASTPQKRVVSADSVAFIQFTKEWKTNIPES